MASNVKIVTEIPAPRPAKRRTQRAYATRGRPALWPGRFHRAREAAPNVVKLNFATAKSAAGMAYQARVWSEVEAGRYEIASRAKDDGTGSVYIKFLGE